jgi:hypothetical protein
VVSDTIGVRIVAPHFVAGVEVDLATARVVRAAPIVGYMVGWTARAVREYVDRKGWEAKRCPARPQ